MWLSSQGVIVKAYDPAIQNLAPELDKFINLQQDLASALDNADAIIVGTECPEFMKIQIEQLGKLSCVFDTGGFLSQQLQGKKTIKYFKVGCS